MNAFENMVLVVWVAFDVYAFLMNCWFIVVYDIRMGACTVHSLMLSKIQESGGYL